LKRWRKYLWGRGLKYYHNIALANWAWSNSIVLANNVGRFVVSTKCSLAHPICCALCALESNMICASWMIGINETRIFLSRACLKQNVIQIVVITLLCWSKDLFNLIILMRMHFLPMQIYRHCLLICSLHAFLIRNMNYF
jgi:hypothetical protein